MPGRKRDMTREQATLWRERKDNLSTILFYRHEKAVGTFLIYAARDFFFTIKFQFSRKPRVLV